MYVDVRYIEAFSTELNKRKIEYSHYGYGLFDFACFTDRMSAGEIYDGLKKQKAAKKEKNTGTVITVNSSGPKIVTGLRNLTPGAWKMVGTSNTVWVFETPSEGSDGNGGELILGVNLFNPCDRHASIPFGSLCVWDCTKYEYLGDNISVSFAV